MIIPNSAIKIALFGFNHKQSPLLNQSACLAKQSARINVNILIINPVVFGIVLSLYDKWRNMKKSIYSLIFFMLIFSGTFAQDTIRVMQYNLMQYCAPYGTCTAYNNGVDAKAANLKTILNYVAPDILVVEEIGSNMTYVNHLLNNALNVNGATWWKNTPLTNASDASSSIANMIYYDSRKFTMKSSSFVQTSVRDFNIVRFYYNTPDLANGDTTYFIPIVGHLKAGTTDTTARNTQVAALMNRLNSINVADNYILCGDFNIYTSEEPCYRQLLNYSNPLVRFYDPINKPGAWNNNYNFANYHTQSTHNTTDSCFSSGGLDDRFDFILTSANVLNGYDNVKAIPSTYHAVGQDGNRYNQSIISPTNNSVPSAVANAMYHMSDHLPLVMDFQMFCPSCILGVGDLVKNGLALSLQNPVTDQLVFNCRVEVPEALSMEVLDINGKVVLRKVLPTGDIEARYSEPVSFLTPGLYFLRLVSDKGVAVARFVKQ